MIIHKQFGIRLKCIIVHLLDKIWSVLLLTTTLNFAALVRTLRGFEVCERPCFDRHLKRLMYVATLEKLRLHHHLRSAPYLWRHGLVGRSEAFHRSGYVDISRGRLLLHTEREATQRSQVFVVILLPLHSSELVRHGVSIVGKSQPKSALSVPKP